MGRSCTLLRTVESWARGGCPECPEFYDSDDDDDDKENDDPWNIACFMCGETAMDGAAVRPVPNSRATNNGYADDAALLAL